MNAHEMDNQSDFFNINRRYVGQVIYYTDDKGFGFIRPFTEGIGDVFVGISGISRDNDLTTEYRSLIQGCYVTFQLDKNQKGYLAKDVKMIRDLKRIAELAGDNKGYIDVNDVDNFNR